MPITTYSTLVEISYIEKHKSSIGKALIYDHFYGEWLSILVSNVAGALYVLVPESSISVFNNRVFIVSKHGRKTIKVKNWGLS